MKIKIKTKTGEVFGKLVGLTYADNGKCMAVVRLNGMGMVLSLYHPSVVTPVDPIANPPKQIIVRADMEEQTIPPAPEEKDGKLVVDLGL